MIILVSSKITQSTIQSSLGKPEYSYFFLLKEFLPVLKRIGEVITVTLDQVDTLYQQYREQGQQVIFLSISPPQQTPTNLQCPTVCLFAWEFPDTPDQPWDNNPGNDWRYVFSRIAGVIACSEESAQAVRNIMGPDYPVIALPAPIWPQYQHLLPETGWEPGKPGRVLEFSGHVIDSRVLGLSADGLVQHLPRPATISSKALSPKPDPGVLRLSARLFSQWVSALFRRYMLLATSLPTGPEPPPSMIGTQPVDNCRLELSGVVFCSMFSPSDGRKNWTDIVTAFCWAFRDTPDATLILKMTHHDLESYRIFLLTMLSRLAPFQCRVLTLHGYLSDQQYRELISASDFYVNASTGEGLCLPLMEFLSAGKPALAPRHTAMLDYLDEQVALVVQSSVEPACWSHDPVGILRTRRHRINWQSLMEGYRQAYQLAQNDAPAYRCLSRNAWERMKAFADPSVVVAPMSRLFAAVQPSEPRVSGQRSMP